jgi:hypothetical protein
VVALKGVLSAQQAMGEQSGDHDALLALCTLLLF